MIDAYQHDLNLFTLSDVHSAWQPWTGHCAIVPVHRPVPPSTNTGNFLTCALRRKILLSLWPLAYAPGRDDY